MSGSHPPRSPVCLCLNRIANSFRIWLENLENSNYRNRMEEGDEIKAPQVVENAWSLKVQLKMRYLSWVDGIQIVNIVTHASARLLLPQQVYPGTNTIINRNLTLWFINFLILLLFDSISLRNVLKHNKTFPFVSSAMCRVLKIGYPAGFVYKHIACMISII